MKYIFTSLLAGSMLFANAQQTQVAPQNNELKQLEKTFKQKFEADLALAQTKALTQNLKLRYTQKDGTIMEFAGFDKAGQMLYNKTYNVGAGRTISTNKVWPGGTIGTALNGAGMLNKLGEWDGGAVLVSHQEFGGRVTQVDGATTLSDHATHVAGTMVASGVDADAKGMSYAASLKAYDWNNDESEMASAATAGMLVSNHSYGTITGWTWNEGENRWEWWGDESISATEDWKFGFYDDQAQSWDNIAYNAPNYLICKAAGNDRGDNFSGTHAVRDLNGQWVTSTAVRNKDGNTLGYDCLPTYSVAKNVLTVGAVNKIGNSNTNNGYVNAAGVVMSSFSGWGPTDDGRIKPDVVAAGVSLYSSFSGSNTDYSSISGTSMATPSVTGSLLLIQQHYNNVKGKYMRSASLKGLVIHTADEAGTTEGPDYKFGWGLVNTAKAVQFITDSSLNQLTERTLTSGSTYTQNISCDGSSPLKVTICWTDVAGTPPNMALNPTTKMLVNDLDIRVTKTSDNSVTLPWTLNPANPAAAATRADNSRDNVEQILIAAPTPGSYTITVSHKGVLTNGAQNYSLIIGGIIGKPSASFSSNVSSICVGGTVTYTDNSGGNPASRVWYFPGGTPSTSTAASVMVSYAVAGKYPVALRVTNAIGTDSTYKSNAVQVGGLTLPFNETFEPNSSSLSSWTVDNPDNDSTWYLAAIGGTTPGNTAACMPFYNSNVLGEKDQLISPALSFKGFQNVTLTFKHAYTNYSFGETDSLNIYISTNCGTTWTKLKALGENETNNFRTLPNNSENYFIPDASNKWCSSNCNTINLSAYDGLNNIKIRFEGVTYYNNNLYLDNIAITGTALKPVTQFGTQQISACVGNPVQFIDSSTNNPTSWQWTFTGATTVNVTTQHPAVIYNTPGTYSVKLKTSNSGGSDSLTKTNYITVLPSPNIPNITSGGKSGLCTGDSLRLSTDSVNTGYEWYMNNAFVNGANTNSYYAKTAANYQVKLIGANGCGRKSSVLNLMESTKPVTPVITSNLSGAAFCAGGTATLTSNANTGNQWLKNGAIINGAVNKTYPTQDSGSFSVITSTNGCSSDMSNIIALSIKAKPVTSAISGETNAKNNSTETYSVTPTAGSTYNWTINGGTVVAGAPVGSINVLWGNSGSGTVSVKETGANQCFGDIKTLNVTLSPNTAIQTISFMNAIEVYPNPTYDDVHITFHQSSNGVVKLNVLNMIGQEVYSETIGQKTSGDTYTIDMDKFNSGIYFVEISSTEGTKQIKVIKK